MTKRALFTMAIGICLAAAAAGAVLDAQAQGRRPVTGPYAPSPVDVPSPVIVPGIVPPAATAHPPSIVTPQGNGGQIGGQAQRPPPSTQPLPSPNGECRTYPGVPAGQKAPPPC